MTESSEAAEAKRQIKLFLGRIAKLVPLIFVPVALLALLLVVLLPAAGFDGSARGAHSFAQVLFPLFVLLAVLAVVVFLLSKQPRLSGLVAGIVGLSIVGGVLSGLGVGSDLGIGNIWSAINRSGHERRIEYVANLTEVTEQRPNYEERIALDQAEFVIRRSLAGVVGDFSSPIRVTNEWCSYITTAAEIRNRWTESVVCVTDDGRVRRASFPEDTVPSVGLGFRRSEISNIIAEEAGSDALFDDGDIYGYITEVDGQAVPRLVVPIADRRGLDLSKPTVPDGAVVFGIDDAGTYRIQVLDDVAPGEHPGPVAGLAAAARIREAVNDSYGFLVSKRPSRSSSALQGTVEVTETEGPDGETIITSSDPNFGNSTEFVLSRDGVPYAVTPLTSFGSASTITAYLEVRLDTITNGEALEATLYRLPEPEAANKTLANTIRVLYGQDLAEADRIYEVTPSVAGTSRITIGREDQVRFVARSETEIIDGELVGEICVESRTGADLDCSQLNADPRPLGTLVFDAASRAPTNTDELGEGTSLQDVPLEDLLAEIERRVNE